MIPLFSEAGQAALLEFIDTSTLFAFDLDGTLAPIVDDPSRIKIPKEVREQLTNLSRVAPVAIISGRACADARSHLGFHPLFVIGNHGAEGLPGRETEEEAFRRRCSQWQSQLETLLPQGSDDGIVIENKGTTLSLHYRRAENREVAAKKIIEIIRQLKPFPRRIAGKCVENILPDEAPRKGEALLQLMGLTGCLKAVYVGDDATDEDVFRLSHDAIRGIRVGCEGRSLADFCLSEQKEIHDLLDKMIRLNQSVHGRDCL